MSIFTELLPKINQISLDFTKTFNENLQEALECFDKFEADFENVKRQARERIVKEKTVLAKLQSIHEDDGENSNTPKEKLEQKLDKPAESSEETEKEDAPIRGPKKRSKHEVDDMSSPEVDKRQKRNASVVAKNIISKQAKENINILKEITNTNTVEKLVNVNLNQKLRREDSGEKTTEKNLTKSKKNKDENKENTEPMAVVQIKQEKLSIPPEVIEDVIPVEVAVKQEVKDDMAMPPPLAPVPKARKAVLKEKEIIQEEEGSRRRTRTRKQTDTLPAPSVPVTSTRATRASSRNTQIVEPEDVIKDARPKRTRGRKKVSEVNSDTEKETQITQDSGLGSPSDKPRPKRTRKGQKATEKETKKDEQENNKEEEEIKEQEIKEHEISPKEEPQIHSPILESHIKTNLNNKEIESKLQETDTKQDIIDPIPIEIKTNIDKEDKNSNTISNTIMDSTIVLPNGVFEHEQVTPKVLRVMNETVVIEKHITSIDKPTTTMNTTVVIDKPVDNINKNIAMDATVVLERLPLEANMTEDNSLLTDDSDTPECVNTPTKPIPDKQPLSAVKEKVQKFEELAARTTRTKTRAMAKKDDVTENVTPPDKISKVILSAENLSKMNNMIFNGKTTQVSSSATKPKSNIPTYKTSSSTSKLSGLTKAREAAEEYQRTEKEDARRKKEALLEAKREAQKKKREEKMAAAAAAREVAERERRAALAAAARGRQEKQAHADQGKLDKMKEVERKKQEQARKLADAEERRKAEEQARALKLIEEQKRAEAARKKQIEEAEAMKKEEAQMLKEVLQRQKEYNEKQKLKYNNRMTPIKSYTSPCVMEPVYMADGFELLNSDEDDDDDDMDKKRPPPPWSTSLERRRQLCVQARLEEGGAGDVERLFSVRPHCPDLRQIFPNIDRARLKRTSSAVWRTPPSANRYKT